MGNHGAFEFGKDLGIIHEAVITGRKIGVGKEFWSALAHDEDLFIDVFEFVIARLTFEIVVNYSQSLAEMIEETGYNWRCDLMDSDINAHNFPIKGRGKQRLNARLFHFSRYMTSDEVITEMNKEGYRPARIGELFAFSARYPHLQRYFEIICLGSVWLSGGRRGYTMLGGDVNRREFNIVSFVSNEGDVWNEFCHFLAISK